MAVTDTVPVRRRGRGRSRHDRVHGWKRARDPTRDRAGPFQQPTAAARRRVVFHASQFGGQIFDVTDVGVADHMG